MVRKSHIVGQAHAAVVTQPLPGPKAWNRASPEQRVQIAERLCNKKVEDIGYGMTRFTAERLLGSLDYRSAKAQLREMCPDVRVSELALNDEDDDDQTPYEVAGPVMARGNVNVNIAPPRHNGRARHGRGEMDDDQYAILQAYKGHLATMKGRMGTVHMDRQPPEDAVPCRPRGFNHTVLCRQNERRY